MRYETHVAGGLMCGALLTQVITSKVGTTPQILPVIIIGSSALGSLFPDIDHRGSYIGRRAKITSAIISDLFGHRGVTHSPFAMLIFTAVLYLISSFFVSSSLLLMGFVGFYTGILSHILLDSLTRGGVPLLYPFKKSKISFTRAKTGGMFESVLFAMLFVSLLFWGKENL